jgi:PAS domain S-box-containing protein
MSGLVRTPVDCEQLVEVIGDAIVVSDASGAINLWNPAAERIFGFTQAEALGNSLDLIIPERLRERHWAGYGKTMASGETRYAHDVLRVPAVHKDGRPLSIAFTVGLLYGPQRAVKGIVAVIRDETTRFAEERNLRKRMAELERNIPA